MNAVQHRDLVGADAALFQRQQGVGCGCVCHDHAICESPGLFRTGLDAACGERPSFVFDRHMQVRILL